MPELPEVETTRLSLAPLLGARVDTADVHCPSLRWRVPDDLGRLVGQRLLSVARRAKYLLLTFEQDTIIIHLGMSGSLQQQAHGTPKTKHEHVVFTLTLPNGNQCVLSYHDPRRFGAILWQQDYASKLLDHLGPEPLSDAFDGNYLKAYCQGKNSPIKSIIMNQACVVGVGNIYATESLFLAGISPKRHAGRISQTRLDALVRHIKAVLSKAIEQGGSTLRDYRYNAGKTGYFQQELLVYGRAGEPCPSCGAPLKNTKINQRASVYCTNCQK